MIQGCCRYSKVVCCSESDYCCPLEYPICDVDSGLCLKDSEDNLDIALSKKKWARPTLPWSKLEASTKVTYKRVVTACLRPLQQFTLELAEGLTSSLDNINKLSHQLSSLNEICQSSEILESFSDFQGGRPDELSFSCFSTDDDVEGGEEGGN